jgi:hypothetical protein
VELLHASHRRVDRRDLIVRHGRTGAIATLLFLLAGLGFMAALAPAAFEALPWFAWLALGPIAALAGLLLLISIHALALVVVRSFSRANWLARVGPHTFDVNLRSFQNAHFPEDAPTVLRLEFGEIARVRRVLERWEDRSGKRPIQRSCAWLELQLRAGDVEALREALRRERDRPAPETRFLGVTSRTRFRHVTAMVTDADRIRVLDASRALRAALARHVEFGADLRVDLDGDRTLDLDARVRARIARGDVLGATALVRVEMGVTTREARTFVQSLREAA